MEFSKYKINWEWKISLSNYFKKMNMKFEKILNCEYIINMINKMIQVIYNLKKKKWEIEFEWDLYWNIINYRFSKEKLILNVFENIEDIEKKKIEELRLKLNEKEYIIYKIELYIDFEEKELKRIMDYEYISEYDRKRIRMKKDLSEWIYLENNNTFIDKIYEKKKKKE